MALNSITVCLHFGEGSNEIRVGELVIDGKLIHFKYDTQFLNEKWELSPLKLPKSANIITGNPSLFDGLPGLFHDSLPDSWGRLLVDRTLQARGVEIAKMNQLDRLSLVGNNGPGALTYQSSEGVTVDELAIDLDKLSNESSEVISGSGTEVIEELFALGGSSGGARPKIQVEYHPEKNEMIGGNRGIKKDGFESWIIKFPSRFDAPDIAHIEYAYYLMAKEAGVNMMPSKLFQGKSGASYFGTKRFDRVENKRVHVHSASGLMHDDYRYSQLDYGHLMDAAFSLTRHVKSYAEVLTLAAFNLYSHNRDDHSKNFSFIMNQQGNWSFAPAFDLTYSTSSHGHHSTSFARESLSPNERHLLELANTFGVGHAPQIIEGVKTAISKWEHFATEAGVTKVSRKQIGGVIRSLIKA